MSFFGAMFNPIGIAMALVVILIGWVHRAIKPPPPKICGSVGGPPVTSPRVKLSDGRHLAYREFGVPKEEARYKIIIIHGFRDGKDSKLINVSQEFVEDLGIYFLSFDRAGYGESDPNPDRSVKSEAYDIQELADQVQIGHKFHILGMSLGGYPVWSCLNYIPHRLSGVALVTPTVSFWVSSFPDNLLREALGMLPKPDQWEIRVAHYAPWLYYWWMNKKWFSSLSVLNDGQMLPPEDIEAIKCLPEDPNTEQKCTQQGIFESLHRDMIAGFGKWEFGPTEIRNPFPNNDGSVHLWHGFKDRIHSYTLMRYIAHKLPWIHYHELPNEGHMFIKKRSECESIIRALLLS